MSKVERTRRVEVDLLTIWNYIAERNWSAADATLRRIQATAEVLAKNRFAGEAIDEVSPGLRRFTVDSFVIIYRPIPDGVRLIRVGHGSRDFQDLLDGIETQDL